MVRENIRRELPLPDALVSLLRRPQLAGSPPPLLVPRGPSPVGLDEGPEFLRRAVLAAVESLLGDDPPAVGVVTDNLPAPSGHRSPRVNGLLSSGETANHGRIPLRGAEQVAVRLLKFARRLGKE